MTKMLDDYALLSPLRYTNNWLKIGVVGFGILMGISSQAPLVPFSIAICMSLATLIFGRVPPKFYLKLLMGPAVFVVFSIIIIAFFFGGGPELFGFNVLDYHLGVNTGGLSMAFLVFSRTLGGMCCLFFLALTTPMVELFSVLKKTGLPDSFIELSMMMYRYIFVFLDVAWCIKHAQTVRLGYHDLKTSLHSMAMLCSTLFLRSWEQGEKTFVAMNARCYDGKMMIFEEKRPVNFSEVALSLTYMVAIVGVWYVSNGMLEVSFW
ncbi:cobalt ECF transporter T component CbiQ [Methanohalophilus sp. RSK]|uniref:cobalt ECF transporter T component CbiQ n=1 Tax=Methanohalophilus sp. RSK TaxID=2485783 RepID=UPI000F439892|nr:cobalt ECF transporter T component CbiQ [Methanohalophilus sp. RSK]RNI15680.1 cobalt ECF transporter T component CbiQ [Methanohalophilus sp. RSK]